TDLSSLMPSTVFTTSSIGCAMSDSTSSGAAPGSPTRTETVGRSTEGKRSTPSLKKPAEPTTTSDKTIIVAKTGRRIQISASFCNLVLRSLYVVLCSFGRQSNQKVQSSKIYSPSTSTGCPDCRLPGSITT